MRRKRKIAAWLIAAALMTACPVFVSGEGSETTSGGAVSAPGTPLAPDTEEARILPDTPDPPDMPDTPDTDKQGTAPAFPISGIPETTYESEQIARTDIVDVSLPNDLPFDIVIFSGTGSGVVRSSDFQITNNGPFPVDISVCDMRVKIANEDAFSVCSDRNLPEEGNNIFINTVRVSGAESPNIILGARPSGENFRFALESGASDAFRFEGLVNEHGDTRWEDTVVTISLHFEITSAGAEAATVPADRAPTEEEDASLPAEGEPATPERVVSEPRAEQAEVPDMPEELEDAPPPDAENNI
jgi:hypothetical protein